MISPAQLTALESAAQSWDRTPFCEGTPVKGAGVSCHHLPAEILFDAGILARIPIPNGPSNWRAQDRSLLSEWFHASDLFVLVGKDYSLVQPADTMLFFVGPLHHAMLQLGGGRVIHSVMGHGVGISPQLPARWARYLGEIWRLKSLA
jgi:hypothetical protein